MECSEKYMVGCLYFIKAFYHIVKQLSHLMQNGLFSFSPFNCVLFLLPDLRYLNLCGGLLEESEIKQVDSTPTTECRLKGYWSLV